MMKFHVNDNLKQRLVRMCCVYPLNAHGPLSMMRKIAEGADRIVFVHPEEDEEEAEAAS